MQLKRLDFKKVRMFSSLYLRNQKELKNTLTRDVSKVMIPSRITRIKPFISRFLYHTSSLFLLFGGIAGVTVLVKYQQQLLNFIPSKLQISLSGKNPEMGRQSLYYCGQFLYFSTLYAWTILFLKRSRQIKSYYYLLAAAGFLIGTYQTDYNKYPTTKHIFWFLFSVALGFSIGAQLYQWNYLAIFDGLYMFANSMSFYAAYSYYTDYPSKSMYVSALICALSGMLYTVGFLRLFNWGINLKNYKTYIGWLMSVMLVIPWMIYRSNKVQQEYSKEEYNPINASLSYIWRAIPQIGVFVDIYHANNQHQANKDGILKQFLHK